MRVTQIQRLADFGKAHADARKALAAWLEYTEHADWRNIKEVRQTYPPADAATVANGRTVTIFNIRGNHYRLITSIDYQLGVVNVQKVMTHAEYSRDRWKATL